MLELLSYTFFQNAIIGAILASILCGIIGTYIVTRRMVFISGGIAHASLGGVGLGAFLGFPPLLGATIVALIAGLSIQTLNHKAQMREDAAIAMIWTFGMSLGLLCAFLTPSFIAGLNTYLFGNILSIAQSDLWIMTGIIALTLLFFQGNLTQIIAVAFDSDFSKTAGIKVARIELIMMLLIALTIISCLHMMGIILVISLLSIPQTTANLLTHNYKHMMGLSIFFSLIGTIGGLMLSAQFSIPSGVSIILSLITLYLLIYAIKNSFNVIIKKNIET